jgi:hypothetical protein
MLPINQHFHFGHSSYEEVMPDLSGGCSFFRTSGSRSPEGDEGFALPQEDRQLPYLKAISPKRSNSSPDSNLFDCSLTQLLQLAVASRHGIRASWFCGHLD